MCPFQASDKSLYDKHLIDVHEIVEIRNNESGEVGLGEDSGIWDTEMGEAEVDHVEEAEVEAKKEALIEQMMLKQLEKNIRKPKKSKKIK